tara:strand:+ start:313 stop:609 length:297 start_codon:yes stop_codon:yes gene_type:complete
LNNSPPTVEPQGGKISNNPGTSDKSDCCDVLQDDDSGSKNADGDSDLIPDPPFVVHARSTPVAGQGNRLAWKPGGHNVDRFHLAPVDRGQVAEVRHPR